MWRREADNFLGVIKEQASDDVIIY